MLYRYEAENIRVKLVDTYLRQDLERGEKLRGGGVGIWGGPAPVAEKWTVTYSPGR